MIIARVPFYFVKEISKILVPVSIVFVLIWLFSFGSGVILFAIRIPLTNFVLVGTSLGLLWGVLTDLRLATMLLSTLTILSATSESELVAGFLGLRVPYIVAFAFSLAFRFTALVGGDVSTIQEARRARGLPEKLGVIGGVKTIASLLVPLVLVTVRRIQTTTNAIEVRAFIPGAPRTSYVSSEVSSSDKLLIVSILVILAGITIARFWLGYFTIVQGRL
jgi:energy-coupling factor transporter transmembrane protein EcfT